MTRNFGRISHVTATMAGFLVLAVLLPASAGADEISDLKAAVAALQARIEQLEARSAAAQPAPPAPAAVTPAAGSSAGAGSTAGAGASAATGGTGALPAWVQNFTFKGDLRYRHETIDQQYATVRNRHRVRARAGFVAKVNDAVRSELALATSEGNDPRSPNQTLDGVNSRKDIFLDLAYVEWQAAPGLKLTAGKMKYPWVRSGNAVMFDGDVNPEGLAASWSGGDFFGSATWNILEERAAAGESTLVATQFGWRPQLGHGRLTLAAGYFDFQGVRGRNPFHAGSANGNSTVTDDCLDGVASCLAWDYNLIEALVEYSLPVGGRPLALHADYVTNDAAGNGLDTAYGLGFTWGETARPRGWEFGYLFQLVEKDSLFGGFADTDLGGGSTDYRAHVLRAGYSPARNWVVNLTWQLAETGMDVPADVGGVGLVRNRNQDRLHLDLNFRY